MSPITRLTAAAIAAAAGLLATAPAAHAEIIYGLTNQNTLVTFDSNTRAVTSTVTLPGADSLMSIDVRPATGQLYGLGNSNQIYSIDPATGAETPVGSPQPASFSTRAIDFNPTVDRLRLVDQTGTNLRINPDTGVAMVDGTLAFSDGTAGSPTVVAAGYTNSLTSSFGGTTTLYDIDATTDSLVRQNPANAGSLQVVGRLGFDITTNLGSTGFDISGPTGTAYLVGNKAFASDGLTSLSLYTVNLTTGAATLAGPVTGVTGGFGALTFRGIAVQGVTAVPEPATLGLAAVAAAGLLGRRRARR